MSKDTSARLVHSARTGETLVAGYGMVWDTLMFSAKGVSMFMIPETRVTFAIKTHGYVPLYWAHNELIGCVKVLRRDGHGLPVLAWITDRKIARQAAVLDKYHLLAFSPRVGPYKSQLERFPARQARVYEFSLCLDPGTPRTKATWQDIRHRVKILQGEVANLWAMSR